MTAIPAFPVPLPAPSPDAAPGTAVEPEATDGFAAALAALAGTAAAPERDATRPPGPGGIAEAPEQAVELGEFHEPPVDKVGRPAAPAPRGRAPGGAGLSPLPLPGEIPARPPVHRVGHRDGGPRAPDRAAVPAASPQPPAGLAPGRPPENLAGRAAAPVVQPPAPAPRHPVRPAGERPLSGDGHAAVPQRGPTDRPPTPAGGAEAPPAVSVLFAGQEPALPRPRLRPPLRVAIPATPAPTAATPVVGDEAAPQAPAPDRPDPLPRAAPETLHAARLPVAERSPRRAGRTAGPQPPTAAAPRPVQGAAPMAEEHQAPLRTARTGWTSGAPEPRGDAPERVGAAVGAQADIAATGAGGPAARHRMSSPATARMVEAVVELQRAAPPRAMVVEIPEMGDLRVQVTLRNGEVHLALVDPGRGAEEAAGWLREVGTALQQRGFDLHSEEHRPRRDQPDTPDRRDPGDPPPRRRRPDRHLRL